MQRVFASVQPACKVVEPSSKPPLVPPLPYAWTTLPSGEEVAHYGIVTEQTGRIEGAELPSDTRHIVAMTLPNEGRGEAIKDRWVRAAAPKP